MQNKILHLSVASLLLLTVGCTEPGKTTGYAAATGGAIGAGLGAIVGSQVGNAGAGLAIGALAGSGAGAAIGNALEAHDKKLATNDERINRQEETIRAQRKELASLRNVETDSYNSPSRSARGGDSFAYNSGSARYATQAEIMAAKNRMQRSDYSARAQLNAGTINPTGNSNAAPYVPVTETKYAPPVIQNSRNTDVESSSDSIRERDLIQAPTTEILPSGGARDASGSSRETGTSTAALNQPAEAAPCFAGDDEMSKANQASDSADKLFHIRRALRLCPSNASYHVQLSDLYLAMNRKDDAVFELNEALKLDPSNSAASSKLEAMQRGDSRGTSSANSLANAKEPKLPSSNRY